MSIVGNIQFKDSYYDQNYITLGEDSVVIACISKATFKKVKSNIFII